MSLLMDDSVVAIPLYTVVDRRVAPGVAPTAWAWECKGKFQDGTPSSWLTLPQGQRGPPLAGNGKLQPTKKLKASLLSERTWPRNWRTLSETSSNEQRTSAASAIRMAEWSIRTVTENSSAGGNFA